MKNRFKLIVCLLLAVLSVFVLVACVPDADDAEFTVTVVNGTGGGKFKKDATCTVTATVGENEEFVEWQINGTKVSDNTTYTFTVTEDVTLTAVTKNKQQPVVKYTVTVVGGEGGGQFDNGATCTVTAAVAADEVFDGWKIDGEIVSTDLTYSFVVNSDVTVTAQFSKKIELGAFARKWVGKEGGILDLTAKTWSLADSFKIVSAVIDGQNTVINCVADETSYLIKLGSEGNLLMFDSEDAEAQPIYAFMASADEFNGLWVLDDEIYVLFVSELDRNGLFGYTLLDGTDIDKNSVETAVTKLTFKNDQAVLEFYVAEYDMTFTLDNLGNIVFEAENLIYAPCAELFVDCYVTADGDVYSLNVAANEVEVNGVKTALEVKRGAFGSGLYFTNNSDTFAFVQTLDGVCLFGESEIKALEKFDASQFNGQWFGKHEITVTNGKSANVDGVDCKLIPVVVDKTVYVGFEFDGKKYTMFSIENNVLVFRMSCADESGYYFKNGIVTKFVGQFGNGANVLEVDDTDGLSVKLGAQTFTDARLTVFEDIDRSINVPLGFNGLQHVAIAFDNASKYVIWTGADSLAVVTKNDDLLTVVGGYYKSEGLESLKNKFCAGLDSSTDIYTTGGTERITVAFDFANGKVLVNDVESAFEWSYFIHPSTGDERVIITFDAQVYGAQSRCTLYPYFEYPYVRLEVTPNEAGAKTTVHTLVSYQEYSKILGTVYYLKGEDFTQSVEFKADGTLILVRSATNTETYVNYSLTREAATKTLVVTFKSEVGIVFETNIYCDNVGVSLTIVTETFLNEALLNAVGVYCDTEGNDVLELLSDAKFKYDEYGLDASATADEFDSITIEGAKVTCMYSSGISIWAVKGTIVFEEGKATVTENDGDSVVYNKKTDASETVIPEDLLGLYCDEAGDPFVELSADRTFKFNGVDMCIDEDTEPEAFDELSADGSMLIGKITYNGLGGSYTVTFVFENGKVTVTEGEEEPVIFTKKIEQVVIPEAYFGKYVDEEDVVCVELLQDGTFKYNEYGIEDEEAETFDSVKADGNKIICVKTYSGIVNYTVTFVFENGKVTVTEDEYNPVVYTKKAESQPSVLTPEAFAGTFEFTEGYEITFVIELTKNGDGFSFTVTVDGGATTDVSLALNSGGLQELTFTDEFDIVYYVVLNNGILTFSDDDMEYGTAEVK